MTISYSIQINYTLSTGMKKAKKGSRKEKNVKNRQK